MPEWAGIAKLTLPAFHLVGLEPVGENLNPRELSRLNEEINDLLKARTQNRQRNALIPAPFGESRETRVDLHFLAQEPDRFRKGSPDAPHLRRDSIAESNLFFTDQATDCLNHLRAPAEVRRQED